MLVRTMRAGTSILLTLALAFTTLAAPALAPADPFPTVPLPDCMPPDLPAVEDVLCEGTRVGSSFAPVGYVGPSADDFSLAISTRTVDFRLDADRGGPQLITFTYTLPGQIVDPVSNDAVIKAIHSKARPIWPEIIADGDFAGGGTAGLECLIETISGFGKDCDGGTVPGGTPNFRSLLRRQDPCADGQASCTYRIHFSSPYALGDYRTRHKMIYRVGLSTRIFYTKELKAGGFDPACGNNLDTSSCIAGATASYVAFASDPPPTLQVLPVVRRLGSRKFEFDGRTSGPDVVAYEWTLGPESIPTITDSVFVHDFALDDLSPSVQGGVGLLTVTDRWARTAITSYPYSFLPPIGGAEGPLSITSFELVGVDENGLATLKAVVKNVGTDTVSGIYLFGSEFLGVPVNSTPDGVELAPDATVEFTVTFQFDERSSITPKVQAFGFVPNGSVKSAESSRKVTRESGPPPTTTTVSQASAAGATKIEVTSNTGFAAGNYVAVNPGGPTMDIRRIEALGSLIFSAPLAHPHAVGEIVVRGNPPGGDTTSPSIAVSSPAGGSAVCQGTPLTATFTCSDGGVGVEECGGAVTSGQALDTTTLGPRQLVIDAWDTNGNASTTTLTYDVVFCSSTLDAFRCYQAKPSKGTPKFTPITGVRMKTAVDDLLVDLKKPGFLCAPADTTGDGYVDAETHLEAYAIAPQKGQPKPVPQTNLTLVSQLGTFTVDLKKPSHLSLPTAEDPSTLPALTTNEVDRFACYPAALAKGQPKLAKGLQLTVADQFTAPPKRVTVKKLVRLCVPVGVDGGATKHDDHLLCFQVAATKGRCALAAPTNAGGGCKKEPDCGGTKGTTSLCVAQPKFAKRTGRQVANDLATGTLDAVKDDVLCLPARR